MSGSVLIQFYFMYVREKSKKKQMTYFFVYMHFLKAPSFILDASRIRVKAKKHHLGWQNDVLIRLLSHNTLPPPPFL